ncbi:acetate and butyrate kinase [Panus rudis PR-1116 ss-1]|nr:acetate and butyrate kinase [Panus rudis PR-1116 ss-1]
MPFPLSIPTYAPLTSTTGFAGGEMSSDPADNLILAVNAGSSSLKISLYHLDPSFNPKSNSSTGDFDVRTQDPVRLLLVSTISSISSPPAKFSFKPSPSNLAQFQDLTGGNTEAKTIKNKEVPSITNHETAFTYFLTHLEENGGIKKESIRRVGHRVVHGGDFRQPAVIDKKSYEHIEELSDLAPLHNGSALTLIRTTLQVLPHAVSIAYFDTAFHSTIPPHISSYAIDQKVAKRRGLRKYGFHGLSYAYILRTVATHLDIPSVKTPASVPPSETPNKSSSEPPDINLIILHLGSGASACCIKNGKSYDTTMGLTPVSGLPGATRSGDVDPSLVFHWYGHVKALATRPSTPASGRGTPSSKKGKDGEDGDGEEDEDEDVVAPEGVGRLSHHQTAGVDVRVTVAEDILNRRSGWKSITGTTDMGEIVKKVKERREQGVAEDPENPDPYLLAYDLLIDRLLTYIGSYYLKLEGKVDAIVFAGGIGEKSVELRQDVVERMACFGFSINKERNANVGNAEAGLGEDKKVVEISESWEGKEGKRVLVCWTDEQLEMARECALEPSFWP